MSSVQRRRGRRRQADTPPLEPLLGANEHILWQEAIERVDKNLGKSLILNAGASAVILSHIRALQFLGYLTRTLLNPARRAFY